MTENCSWKHEYLVLGKHLSVV